MQTWFWLSILTLILFGISGITQKLTTNSVSFETSFLWFSVAMALISALVAPVIPQNWHAGVSLLALAALGGCLNGLGALTSFAALEKGGKASIVIPIINLYPLITIGGAWAFLGEKLSLTQVAGIFFALVAVAFLSQETPQEQPTRA